MYTIGDRVMVNKVLTSTKSDGRRTWAVEGCDTQECVYLGTGQRWDGEFTWEYGDEDTPYDRRIWVNTKYHACYNVQPIDIGGRYRKPIAVPLDGIVTDS